MNLMKELEKIEEENLIEILKKESLPLVMWGAGNSAPEVSEYLRQNNIFLADVFVDDQFYEDNKLFEGKPVLSYSLLREKYDAMNVIIGNSNYEKIEKLKSFEGIRKVFCLFSMSYYVYDKTPISVIESDLHEFEMAYSCFEDELSKQNFIAFLKTRISGNNQYISEVFNEEGNFFNNDIFHISTNEVYLDVGAFNGDTIRLFIKENSGRYRHIYALEPDNENYVKLKSYLESGDIKNISIKKCGAWDENCMIKFYSSGNQISSVLSSDSVLKKEYNAYIQAAPLDNVFDYSEEITLLKINYFEGVVEALQGAKKILQKHTPKLAIAVGFDCRNIKRVPIIIKSINPSYRLYLRFNRGMASTLTLYGMV